MDNKTFLKKRRDRVIATFLSFKEAECDRYLPKDVSSALREEFLYQINELCGVALDLISDSDVVWNEEFMERFDALCDQVDQLSK